MLVLDEIAHHVFELMLVHLAVADADARLRNQRTQMARDVADVLDPVVYEEHLAAAIELAQNDFAHQAVFEMRDESANRLAIRRRRLDHRQIANPQHRHMQRARNRRRGQRQHVDQLAHLLHLLFVGDAEAMLLIDDQQAQLGELHILREQAMRADDDIDLAAPDVVDYGLVLLRRAEARYHLDAHRQILEAVAEVVPMLLGENRGWHEDC